MIPIRLNQIEDTFLSANGVTDIHYIACHPTGAVKGVVQLTHGMCEHIARYQEWIDFLAKNGYAVYGHDHLGHGRSVSDESELGFFGEQSGCHYLVEDLHTVTEKIRETYPTQPIFLLGHSMGSFVSRLYLARYGNEVQGVLLSGTCGKIPLSKMGLSLVRLWINTKGKRYRSKTLKKMIFGDYNKRLSSPRTPNDWLSRDPAAVDAFNRDPLSGFIFTNVAFRDLLTMIERISADRWFEEIPKNVPILLFSGEMDPVGNYGAGVRKLHRRLLDAGVDEVRIRIYPEGRHEMLRELNRDEVYQDILSWLEEHSD